jgi:hypothetical protein
MRGPTRTGVAAIALLLGAAACAKKDASRDVGAVADSTASGMSDSASSTGMSDSTNGAGMSDSMTPGKADSAKGNQSKSGVTDTKTGKSTLGPGATKTRPDQGQPVTSKGDTIKGQDSSTTAR